MLVQDINSVFNQFETINDMASSPLISLGVKKRSSSGIKLRNRPVSINSDKLISFSINSTFIKNLLSKEIGDRWIDVETEYFDTLNQLLSVQTKDDVKSEIIKLNEDLDFIKLRLLEYLRKLESNSNLNKSIKANPEFAERMHHFLYPEPDYISGKLRSAGKRLIVNYNYTSTVKHHHVRIDNMSTEIINIHGSLEDGSEIIFGFGSVDSPELKKILDCGYRESTYNLKHMRYHVNGQNEPINKLIEEGPFIVRIVGHSCGASDGSTLRKLFEHRNCERISICYVDNNEHFDKLYDIYNHVKNEYKELKIQPRESDLKFLSLKNNEA